MSMLCLSLNKNKLMNVGGALSNAAQKVQAMPDNNTPCNVNLPG